MTRSRTGRATPLAGIVNLGNTRPLIPLSIDPPQHIKYRKILDPLFAPKRMDALEAEITTRVNRFIDTFADRGSCHFTDELRGAVPIRGLPRADGPAVGGASTPCSA